MSKDYSRPARRVMSGVISIMAGYIIARGYYRLQPTPEAAPTAYAGIIAAILIYASLSYYGRIIDYRTEHRATKR